MMTPIEALAEAWASIDGKLAGSRIAFLLSGVREHYESKAAEMIRRLEARGYRVTAVEEKA